MTSPKYHQVAMPYKSQENLPKESYDGNGGWLGNMLYLIAIEAIPTLSHTNSVPHPPPASQEQQRSNLPVSTLEWNSAISACEKGLDSWMGDASVVKERFFLPRLYHSKIEP